VVLESGEDFLIGVFVPGIEDFKRLPKQPADTAIAVAPGEFGTDRQFVVRRSPGSGVGNFLEDGSFAGDQVIISPDLTIGFRKKINRFSAEGSRVLRGHAMRSGRKVVLKVLVSTVNRRLDHQSNPSPETGSGPVSQKNWT
jgi:hypothetical protein